MQESKEKNIESELTRKTRYELKIIAKKLHLRGYSRLAKPDLVSLILAKGPTTVRKHLRITWWDKHHNHVYGCVTCLGVIAAITFWWFPRPSVQPKPRPVERATVASPPSLLACLDELYRSRLDARRHVAQSTPEDSDAADSADLDPPLALMSLLEGVAEYAGDLLAVASEQGRKCGLAGWCYDITKLDACYLLFVGMARESDPYGTLSVFVFNDSGRLERVRSFPGGYSSRGFFALKPEDDEDLLDDHYDLYRQGIVPLYEYVFIQGTGKFVTLYDYRANDAGIIDVKKISTLRLYYGWGDPNDPAGHDFREDTTKRIRLYIVGRRTDPDAPFPIPPYAIDLSAPSTLVAPQGTKATGPTTARLTSLNGMHPGLSELLRTLLTTGLSPEVEPKRQWDVLRRYLAEHGIASAVQEMTDDCDRFAVACPLACVIITYSRWRDHGGILMFDAASGALVLEDSLGFGIVGSKYYENRDARPQVVFVARWLSLVGTGTYAESVSVYAIDGGHVVRALVKPYYEHNSGWGAFDANLVEFRTRNEFAIIDNVFRIRTTGAVIVVNDVEDERGAGATTQAEREVVINAVAELPQEQYVWDPVSMSFNQIEGRMTHGQLLMTHVYSDYAGARGDWFVAPPKIEESRDLLETLAEEW